MAQKQYDEAIINFREHLRSYRDDFDSWNQLAAAYYHTGLPKRALRYLKSVARKTRLKSFNFFYQGLCYSALNSPRKARTYFQYASAYKDPYGGRALFELGTIYYNKKKPIKSRHWLALYVQRYPNGPYHNLAVKLIRSIDERRFLPGVKGVEKPDMEKALFKYNKLSLFNEPHYWYAQIGSSYDFSQGFEVTDKGAPKEAQREKQSIIANTGIGFGPLRQGKSTILGGYTYKQNWFTNSERLDTYTEDFTDIEYQPFRPDLLERRHQIYGDFRRKLIEGLYLGLFGRIEFARAGSQFSLIQEDENLPKKTVKISDTTLFIPWIGYSWTSNMRSLFYFYLRNEINDDSPDFSNKTYSFLEGEDTIPISLGLSHSMSFPSEKLEINLELFRYDFIYNDFFQDYSRYGGLIAAEYHLIAGIYLQALGGYYYDYYISRWPRIGNCSSTKSTPPEGTDNEANKVVTNCYREETGFLASGGIYWNYSQFHRISAELTYIDNFNETQSEFSETRYSIVVVASMAFPSVKRVLRYVDRFSDSALTKQPE